MNLKRLWRIICVAAASALAVWSVKNAYQRRIVTRIAEPASVPYLFWQLDTGYSYNLYCKADGRRLGVLVEGPSGDFVGLANHDKLPNDMDDLDYYATIEYGKRALEKRFTPDCTLSNHVMLELEVPPGIHIEESTPSGWTIPPEKGGH